MNPVSPAAIINRARDVRDPIIIEPVGVPINTGFGETDCRRKGLPDPSLLSRDAAVQPL